MQRRIPKGLVSFLILDHMADGPTYGYEILKKLEELSKEHWSPSYGTVYGALERMEDRGYIKRSNREKGNRKYYELTQKGLDRLDERRKEIEDMADNTSNMILGFLNVYKQIYGNDRHRELLTKIKKEFESY